MRILKTPRTQIIMLCLAVLAAAVFTLTPHAFAGGADGYKATVTNPTDITVMVAVAKNTKPFWRDWTTMVVIPPKGSHTFSTGAICPMGFKGLFKAPVKDNWLEMKTFNCLGYDCPETLLSTCCWDLNVKICRKVGEDEDGYRNNDYGFCNN